MYENKILVECQVPYKMGDHCAILNKLTLTQKELENIKEIILHKEVYASKLIRMNNISLTVEENVFAQCDTHHSELKEITYKSIEGSLTINSITKLHNHKELNDRSDLYVAILSPSTTPDICHLSGDYVPEPLANITVRALFPSKETMRTKQDTPFFTIIYK